MDQFDSMSDEQLRQLAAQKMKQVQPQPVDQFDSLDDNQLRELANQKIQQMQQPQVSDEEANLGLKTRFKYSLEPIESNRRALLVEQFGADNVIEDKSGNVFIRQGDQIRPVNAPGISFTDVADIAGATPEALGATAGGLLGFASTGGAATIPGIAAGSAIGSGIRQGLSALIGTPQVAKPIERVAEVGLSAATGAAGAALGKAAKTGLKKVFPSFRVNEKLKSIAKDVGVNPTSGQLAGGRDLDIEKQIAETPVFGRKIKKIYEEQANKIKDNLSKSFGDFADLDLDQTGVGSSIKERTNAVVKGYKEAAGELFDKVAENGADVVVPQPAFKSSLVQNFGKLGLVDKSGLPAKYSVNSGLTRSQFERLQAVTTDIVSNIDELAESGVSANNVNTIRKIIDENISEGVKDNVSNAGLVRMRNSFMDLTEEMLASKDKGLKNEFRAARGLYKKYLDGKDLLEKGKGLNINNLSDEKVLDRIFRDAKSVKAFREIADEKTVKEVGDSFVNNVLREKIGKQGKITAAAALSNVRKKRGAIVEAIGRDKYNTLINNLEYLDVVGEPINPSKTFLQDLRGNLVRGATLSARKKGREVFKNSLENLPKRSGSLGNILTDKTQREGSDYSSGRKNGQGK